MTAVSGLQPLKLAEPNEVHLKLVRADLSLTNMRVLVYFVVIVVNGL